ncbi:SH3 domain-containing protein [Streptomyces sp. NPDC048442]|uniref:SH3 domain-containing protein n=1 Tax=Streptomyces sp. NPDC048442 TaxID=3154823 RepID=UPI00341CD890
MSVTLRRTALVGLSVLFMGAGLGAAPAAVADATTAAACAHPRWSNKDSGVDHVRDSLLNGAPVRTGPNEGCGVVGRPNWVSDVYLHCYVFNSAGNTWSHVRAYNRFTADEYSGWIYDKNLEGKGSTQPC